MNATSVPIAAAAQRSNDAFSEEEIALDRFEKLLDDSYDVTNRQKVKISRDNKRGETLFLHDGSVFCRA